MKQLAIYLAGSIKKGHENNNDFYWSDDEIAFLKKELKAYTVSFLNPAFRFDDLSDQRSVFGRDMLQVFSSDVVFVDARDRRGLGVGAEMMWAKLNSIPVICLAPKDSHYHKSQTTILGVSVESWVHPFVESLSDKIVENLADGAIWIHQLMTDAKMTIKGRESIEDAMEHYKKKQLNNDMPMQELILTSPLLKQRIHEVIR